MKREEPQTIACYLAQQRQVLATARRLAEAAGRELNSVSIEAAVAPTPADVLEIEAAQCDARVHSAKAREEELISTLQELRIGVTQDRERAKHLRAARKQVEAVGRASPGHPL